MTLAKRALKYTGVRPANPPNVQLAKINPTTQNDFVDGDIWLNTVLFTAFMWSANTWIALGSGTTGAIVTLTASSGGPLSPSAGNINILGTANQITTAGSGSTITLTLPSAIIAPGSIASTTTITAGTGLTVTTGNAVVSAGNISTTLGSISSHTTLSAGTTITATLGAITATNGNLVLGTAGNKVVIATGSNASVGTSAAMSGTPGVVTVATTASSTTALIFYARKTAGGTLGNVSITAQDGTGFTLTSTGNETSTFYWWIINA
jgi:hypothetical protein